MKYSKKRGASGVIFLNEEGKILFLEPTYKDDWEILGGIIEENESPKEACEREIREELGLSIDIEALLCLEYQREEDDSYMFIFDGGTLSQEQIENISLQKNEIKSYRFCDVNEVEKYILKKMYIRIHKALEAKRKSTTTYYETIY